MSIDGTDQAVLLAQLEARGQEFLQSFASPRTKRGTKPKDRVIQPANTTTSETNTALDNELDEWTGFASESDLDYGVDRSSNLSLGPDGAPEASMPDVVVFCEGKSKNRTPLTTKAQARAFMSSKITKLKEFPVEGTNHPNGDEGADIERSAWNWGMLLGAITKPNSSNTHNDALLHRLVHTQLLSGSLNPELNMTAAQQRKALAGRVLELAGDSKLGKGETVIRQEEKKRASKRVRDGLAARQKERDVKSLNEAKNSGNYHPTLKRLFAASSGTPSRKRDRGLKMGIGRFSGGMLKLTPEEIGSVRDVRTTRGRGRAVRRGK